MGRVVVFDSGLGSLSIIKAIQQITKAEIIYFADQKNFPYGNKSIPELNKIISNTVSNLKRKFNPDLIVMASNTPSLLLRNNFLHDKSLVFVLPPIQQAQKLTKTKSIAVLATKSVTKSYGLTKYLQQYYDKNITITKINVNALVSLVECGSFIHNEKLCIKKIQSTLEQIINKKKIDVVTLSSTHLPFLFPLLTKVFPKITFLDPSTTVADTIKNNALFSSTRKNSLKIFTSGEPTKFQKILQDLGIRNTVKKIVFNFK